MNIIDIKVTYRSDGPNIEWVLLKKLHPAISAIRSVSKHIGSEFGTETRGNKQAVPKRVLDVQKLHQSCHSAGHHTTSLLATKLTGLVTKQRIIHSQDERETVEGDESDSMTGDSLVKVV